jgi:protease I
MLNRILHRNGPLAGRRIAVLAVDGFELVELVVPANAMRLAGATVDVISIHPGHIRGMNLHEPGMRVGVDLTLDEANPDDYDGLLIPGGFVNPDLLRQSAAARAFVRSFGEAGKPIASLCHGPWVLASAGLLDGRRLTSWPREPGDEPRAAGHEAVRHRDHPAVRRAGPRAGIPRVARRSPRHSQRTRRVWW